MKHVWRVPFCTVFIYVFKMLSSVLEALAFRLLPKRYGSFFSQKLCIICPKLFYRLRVKTCRLFEFSHQFFFFTKTVLVEGKKIHKNKKRNMKSFSIRDSDLFFNMKILWKIIIVM